MRDAIEAGGFRIAYERAGDGPPLLLLHGYVGDGPSTWRRQIDALSDEFTVVAWDAPGAGGSSDPPEGLGMAGYADALAGLVEALGLARPHVCGLSFGGALALELTRRHRGVARTLVLASAYAGWAGSLSAEEADRRLAQAHALARLSAEGLVEALLPTMFSAAVPQEAADAFRAAMLAFRPAGLRAMARAVTGDLSDALPGIDVPTLVVAGERDVRAPVAVAEALHAAIPRSRLVVLPGVGHVCNVEAPEAFDRVVRGFLRAHGP